MAGTISVAQLTTLINFLEGHPQLALGRCTRTKEGRSLAKRLWSDCATLLNSVSINCAQKTAEQWRVYYNEYKSKLLKKIKCEKNERSATGGGRATNFQFTPLQDRLYTILGRDVGEPLPGVRHNPIIEHVDASRVPEIEHDGASLEAGPSANENNIMFETDDDEEINIFQEVEVVHSQPQIQPLPEETESLGYLEELERQDLENFKKMQKLKSMKIKKKKAQKKKQKKNDKISAEELEHEPTMREAVASLHRIEQINADAMLVHATAINRLAAAIERLADRLPEAAANVPVSSPAEARRRRHQMQVLSDSE